MWKPYSIAVSRLRTGNFKRFSSEINPIESNRKTLLLKKLSTEFEDVSCIVRAVLNDYIKIENLNELRKRINILKEFDFKDKECFKMISLYPEILNIPCKKLRMTTLEWCNANLRMKFFYHIMLARPEFFDVKAVEIRRRVPHLSALVNSKHHLSLLLENNPNVMFEDWQYILKKIDFLRNEKGITRRDLAESKGLSMSLDFLRMRFDILEKCGIFKKTVLLPHKYNKYTRPPLTNPRLRNIITEDLNFSTNTAKISLEEYNIASELFFKNNDELKDYYNNDFSDDETDDEDLSLSYKKIDKKKSS